MSWAVNLDCIRLRDGKRNLRAHGAAAAFCALALDGLFTTIQAQEPIRASLAREAAAAGRARSLQSNYNLRFGPVRLKLDAGLDLEFNDNVNLADPRLPEGIGPRSDFFFRPRLNIGAFWPVTQLNTLTLRLGFGYEFSINDTRASNVSPFTIAPDSEIGFDIFIGDVRINLHDRFGIENNPASQSTLSNTGSFSRFTNTTGLSALVDLNDVILIGGSDYTIDRYTGATFRDNDRSSHQFRASSSFALNETTILGLQSSFTLSTTGKVIEIAQQFYTLGPFAQFQISPYTRFLAAAGVQVLESSVPSFRTTAAPRGLEADHPDAARQISESGRTKDSGGELGYYWSIAINNRLNSRLSHSLSAGHERQLGIGSDYVDIDYLRYEASIILSRKITFGLSAGYERAKESRSTFGENLTRWNFGLALGYSLSEHLRAGLRYQFYSKESELAFRDYRQNVLTLTFSYDF